LGLLQSSFPAKQRIVKVSNRKSQGSLIMQNWTKGYPEHAAAGGRVPVRPPEGQGPGRGAAASRRSPEGLGEGGQPAWWRAGSCGGGPCSPPSWCCLPPMLTSTGLVCPSPYRGKWESASNQPTKHELDAWHHSRTRSPSVSRSATRVSSAWIPHADNFSKFSCWGWGFAWEGVLVLGFTPEVSFFRRS